MHALFCRQLAKMPFLVAFSLAGCTNLNSSEADANAQLVFNGYFRLYIPQETLTGAKFFVSDGPAIKFNDGTYISGTVITRELEGLPEHFDLMNYPEYILGLAPIAEIDPPHSDRFARSRTEIKASFPESSVDTIEQESNTIFSLCSDDNCLTFVTQDDQDEQILMLNSEQLTQQDISRMIKGQ